MVIILSESWSMVPGHFNTDSSYS